jgi:uncharacterized membrane protein
MRSAFEDLIVASFLPPKNVDEKAARTTTTVFVAQNRQTQVEQQHPHLELRANLLTQEKILDSFVSIEEFGHDLPMVNDRQGSHVAALQDAADASRILSLIEEVRPTTNQLDLS